MVYPCFTKIDFVIEVEMWIELTPVSSVEKPAHFYRVFPSPVTLKTMYKKPMYRIAQISPDFTEDISHLIDKLHSIKMNSVHGKPWTIASTRVDFLLSRAQNKLYDAWRLAGVARVRRPGFIYLPEPYPIGTP